MRFSAWMGFCCVCLCVTALRAEDTKPKPAAKVELAALQQKGANFLRTTQGEDGSWTSPKSPGITGLVAYSLLQSGLKKDDPAIAKALTHLKTFVKPDGGIYDAETPHKNYETSICLLAFQSANTSGEYDALVKNAVVFLKKIQWGQEDGADPTHPAYGGAGYGKSQRPDLSNTAFFVEALKAGGIKEDDPAMQKVLVFVSRTQNLESEHNTTPFAAKVNDGGFYYTPAAGGNSQAGNTPEGGLRSYASMTYAGLKSMIYAGLKSDDPRVKAASTWIRKHYAIAENPGLGQQGVYYYFHTFAKTLAVMHIDQFEDADGKTHDWRQELLEEIATRQRANGSWVNPTERWIEGDPHLATAYALMALRYCEKP